MKDVDGDYIFRKITSIEELVENSRLEKGLKRHKEQDEKLEILKNVGLIHLYNFFMGSPFIVMFFLKITGICLFKEAVKLGGEMHEINLEIAGEPAAWVDI